MEPMLILAVAVVAAVGGVVVGVLPAQHVGLADDEGGDQPRRAASRPRRAPARRS